MKELQQIVNAYKEAVSYGFKAALATVVQVEGSAYRHEGARMLIREDGQLTGAISGGCLEGDALRKALLAMSKNQNMLVTYDTTDDDDAKLGVGLGCNGIIQVLIEPIDSSASANPINLFKRFLSKRQKAVIGTFFSFQDRQAEQPGTCMLLQSDEAFVSEYEDQTLKNEFESDARRIVKSGSSIVKEYGTGQKMLGFLELLRPPVSMLIFGAGNDAIPLVQFASILGWEAKIIDGRPNYASPSRFPLAQQVRIAKSENVLEDIIIDDRTVAVLMTHNYNYDLSVLRQLLNVNIRYIGTLGPKKKLQRMLDELGEEGLAIPEEKLQIIFGPTGLDIGSQTPEEIALSIISEINAVLTNRDGRSLRLKPAGSNISPGSNSGHQYKSKFASCPISL